MKYNAIDRRSFLQLLSFGGAVLGSGFSIPTVVGRSSKGALVESVGEYGSFLVEKMTDGSYPYEYDSQVLKKMSEKNNTFSRNGWAPDRMNRPELTENLTHEYLVKGGGKIPNQTRLDYALMAASWRAARSDSNTSSYGWNIQPGMVSGLRLPELGKWDPADIDMTWEDVSRAVKHAALFFGASQAGIAHLNPLWIYSDHYAPVKEDRARAIQVLSDGDRFEQTNDAWYIPESMNRVIVFIFEEDYLSIANSPGRLASAAVGNGYSRMAFTSGTLADFIRALGYRAIPGGNGVGLSIPMAIDAGLGEIGRNGLLITPKYGPRVRIAKVITDMPLVSDTPINFGVSDFCKECKLCADQCPSSALSKGERTWEGKSPTNNPGVLKWYIESEKCYDFHGFSCSNCKNVCPFNKPNNSWLHKLTRKMVEGRISVANKLMIKLDQASGYGEQFNDTEFWRMDGHKSITARESM